MCLVVAWFLLYDGLFAFQNHVFPRCGSINDLWSWPITISAVLDYDCQYLQLYLSLAPFDCDLYRQC